MVKQYVVVEMINKGLAKVYVDRQDILWILEYRQAYLSVNDHNQGSINSFEDQQDNYECWKRNWRINKHVEILDWCVEKDVKYQDEDVYNVKELTCILRACSWDIISIIMLGAQISLLFNIIIQGNWRDRHVCTMLLISV